MSDHIRIIVTGSRLWADKQTLFDALDDATIDYRHVTVVHGMCDPRMLDGSMMPWSSALASVRYPAAEFFLGADWWTDRHARRRGWNVVTIPANWKSGSGSAGPRRNRAMINQGADLVVGFPLGESKGTRGCLKMAIEAMIPVRTYEGVPDAQEPTPGA